MPVTLVSAEPNSQNGASSSGRVTYLFRAGRPKRLYAPGEAPTEFLYGFPQLLAAGWQVELLEDADIGMAPPLAPLAAFVNKTARLFGGLPVGMAVPLLSDRQRSRVPRDGIIVATTNGMGLALAIGRMLGLVEVRVVLLAMGLLSTDAGAWRRFMMLAVARRLDIVTISRPEQEFLQTLLPDSKVRYAPFGVDKGFWRCAPPDFTGDGYVLSIGNDANRDWETLVKAWHDGLPKLKIITSLPVPASGDNVEVIRGDWRTLLLSDKAVRELYWGAEFVVVPVRETIQPTGQSACLQAMACGKAVIMGDNSGLWDREVMRDGDNVLLVPPGDATALAETAAQLTSDRALRQRLGARGRETVEHHYNTDLMAESLSAIFEKLEA
jgi:glycosyltransferase involved in cell wall biosynthesis